jgi:hypothetical protein
VAALPLSFSTPGAAEETTRFFPLPMYTTVPNEGSTYGVLPVWMVMEGDQGVKSITAPSVSWNHSAGVTGTFRYYRYFGTLTSAQVIASASTNINRNLWLEYDDIRRTRHGWTTNLVLHVRRNLFYRFFGLGPDTTEAGESSYTRLTGVLGARRGYNFTEDFNVAVFLELDGDNPERHAITGLPETQVVYPTAPGLNGAFVMREGVSVRYDTRPEGDYSANGLASELTADLVEGIIGVGFFARLMWQTRLVLQETSWLQLGARAYWSQLFGGGDNVPFYYQASLGGEYLLRGFTEDRFIDRGAWEIEFEQRFRLFESHMFGVVSEWRLDPFIAVGQVYGIDGPFSHVRAAGGVGIRVWILPNVVGRIDVAYGGEGLKAYVMLGYPY